MEPKSNLPKNLYVRRRAQQQILAGYNRERVLASEAQKPRFGSMVLEGKSKKELLAVLNDPHITAAEKQKLVGTDLKALGLSNETLPSLRGKRSYASVLRPTLENNQWMFAQIDQDHYDCFQKKEYTANEKLGRRALKWYPTPGDKPIVVSAPGSTEPQTYKITGLKFYNTPNQFDCVQIKMQKTS